MHSQWYLIDFKSSFTNLRISTKLYKILTVTKTGTKWEIPFEWNVSNRCYRKCFESSVSKLYVCLNIIGFLFKLDSIQFNWFFKILCTQSSFVYKRKVYNDLKLFDRQHRQLAILKLPLSTERKWSLTFYWWFGMVVLYTGQHCPCNTFLWWINFVS